MKLLKLSIQSIILLYQLLVREHRKKSRLRSAASQLLLGLALSHDYVSKNSLAFTCQTLFKDAVFLPTKNIQFEWKHNNLFCINRKKYSLPHCMPFGFPKALKSYVYTASHHLMPEEEKSLQKSSYKHQRYIDALPGCSPDHKVTSQLGKLPGSAHFPDLPRGLLRSEMAPDGHSTTHSLDS